MAWKIGKCSFCGEPKGDWAACVFRVRHRAPVLLRWVLRRPWMRVWRWQCDDCGPSWAQAEAKKQARHERAARRRALKGAVCPDCHTTNAHIDLCSWAGSDGLPVLPTVPEPLSRPQTTATAGAWGRGELIPPRENTILEATNHD